MIPPEVEEKILRYHLVEKWRVGTIARQVGVHHTTVQRVLATHGTPKQPASVHPSKLDPFKPYILEVLGEYPTLPASRLYVMCVERGYDGCESHFRRVISTMRPRRAPEAFLRLRTLPGEQGQMDWGHFGHITVGRAQRALMAFVMVLSWSRRIVLRFYAGHRMGEFLDGHLYAFGVLGGVPRRILYDNLKSAVLERRGDAIRFNPTLLSLASHYRFEPRPVAIARGNEKGRVERAIRYIRGSFFAARKWTDLEDLNAQAAAWCEGLASARPWPDERTKTVAEAFAEEQPRLLGLPVDAFPAEDVADVKVGKTPYVRFDLNDYSVPHGLVRQRLTVRASVARVRVLDGVEVVAEHSRSYDRGAQVEDARHVAALVEMKRQARREQTQDRLVRVSPGVESLLEALAERGVHLGREVRKLGELLDRYGAEEFGAAVEEVLRRGLCRSADVGQQLDKRRQARQLPPVTAVALPDDPRVRDVSVKPHALASYDPEPSDHEGPDDV